MSWPGGRGQRAHRSACSSSRPGRKPTRGRSGCRGQAGFARGISQFAGDAVTVTAPAGNNAITGSAGAAGGAAGTGGFAGGAGGAGTATTAGGGGGGGSSGGTAGAGNTGGAASGGTGGAGGAAVAGGGIGGRGGTKNVGNGQTPVSGYGGGAGGSPGGATGSYIPPGKGGVVTLTYTSTQPSFQTLIAHRPPVTAPDSLLPFVSPSPSDVPDGSTFYPVGSLVPGVNARFAGSYTAVLVASSSHTPTAARSISVVCAQN